MKKIILTFIATLLAGVNTALAQNVAEIGEAKFSSLQEAFAAVQDGETIGMLTDVTLAAPMDLELAGKKVTLDLGGKTLTGRTNLKSGELLIQNGNIAGGNQQALNVYGSATAGAENYSVLTIASDVAVTADVFGVCLFGPTATAPAGYGAVINIAGSVSTTGNGSDGAVFVSGNLGKNISGDMNNKIDILGTITSTKDAAIALNGNATVTVDAGATITGNTAIAIKRGTLNVTGGTIHSTGASNIPPAGYMNGTEMSGAGISMTNTYNQYGGMSVEITGGTIISDHADALYKEDDTYTNAPTFTVKGGTFSSDVSAFLATDHIISQKANGDFIVLSQADAVAKIGTTAFYASLEDAFAAVENGQTIEMLADITLTSNITCNLEDGQSFTLYFVDYDITKGDYSVSLPTGVSVTTDKQTDIFTTAAEGMVVKETDNGNNTYTYSVATIVAQIGTTPYATLKDAIDAAVDGDEIVIVADGPMGGRATIDGKAVTITGEGTINASGSTDGITVKNGGTLNLGKADDDSNDVTFDGGSTYHTPGVFQTEGNGTVNMYDGISVEKYNSNSEGCVQIQGNGDVFNMYGGSIGSTDDAATYGITVGTYGASTTGVFNLMGGTITGSDDQYWPMNVMSGTFNMTGGTVQGGQYAAAAASYDGKINISGGQVIGVVGDAGDDEDPFTGSIQISGGTYTVQPDADYIVEGYEAVALGTEPETWTVSEIPVAIIVETNTNYDSFAGAIAAVENGQTILLRKDVTLTEDVTCPLATGNSFTLNFDSKTITANGKKIILNPGVLVNTDATFNVGNNAALYGVSAEGYNVIAVKVADKQGFYAATLVDAAYVDAAGEDATAEGAVLLDAVIATFQQLPGGWYYAEPESELSFENQTRMNASGSNFIIGDGATVNFTNSLVSEGTITIFGQTEQTGTIVPTGNNNIKTFVQNGAKVVSTNAKIVGTKMTVNTGLLDIKSNTQVSAVVADIEEVNINGGEVTVEALGSYGVGVESKDITITGGKVTISGDVAGLRETSGSTIELSLDDINDFILVSSYDGTVKIKEGVTLYDKDDTETPYRPYSGTLNDEDKARIAGHTLVLASILRLGTDDTTVLELYDTLDEAIEDVVDGQFIHLTANVTLTDDIEVPLAAGEEFSLKFGTADIDGNGKHIVIPAEVSVNTDKQTNIFAVPEDKRLTHAIKETQNEDGTYTYTYTTVEAVAYNQQTNIRYATLQGAIDDAASGQTIVLMPAIEKPENTLTKTVVIKKNITIDGQGDEGDNLQVKSDAKVAFEVTGPGSVTFNKVDIYAQYYDPEGAENHMKSGSRAIKVDEQFGDSLVINYSTIQSTGRGIDVYDVNGGFVLDVKHSNIEAILQDGDEATAGYINSFDTDPDGRGRGINFSHKAASIVANIQFSKIQGYAYPVHVWNESGKVELNMTDCSTWGRNIINNEGDNSTFNLKNVTSHSYNNEDSEDNEAFAAIVDYKTADLNFYNIEDLKVVAVVKAADIDPTSATQNFIDLRGTNATVKITGNSGYVTSDTDTNLSKEIRDRVGFVNKLIIADDVEVGESDAYKRMIDKTVNNRIYFDDESKSYFNFWFEIMEPFEYDYDNDTEDELIRIAIADKTDYTNLYPVVPLEVKVRMTIMSEDSGEPVVLYYGNLEDAFNSELFGSAAEIQLLSDVELDEDITVRLERGEDFTLTLINDGGDVCAVNVSNDASIKLPPLVYAYCNEAQGATLFTSADETLAVIKGANNGVSGLIKYYVPANVYYADTKEKAVGNPDDDEYEPNIDGGLLWIFKDLLSTDADAMLQITPDCYVRLEANVTLDETYTLPIGGDVDSEEVFYLDLNGKTIDGEYKSLVMRLGTAIYTTGTIDIFSSIDPEYTVVYDVLDDPITTTYTDFEGNSKTVSFTHKYYLMKDGLAVIVDPSTYCGDRLTPNFIVKKKVVDAGTGEESWVELVEGTDYTWSLVPPATDDADDKTYIDAKTYVQAIVIEGITFQGTRKADFTILPRDIKDVTASGNEQPWRAEGYTPEDIKNLIELQYFCTTHANPANPVLVRDVDYRISVVGENAAQSAIGYTYSDYTYNGQFTQTDATTVDYTITPGNANSTNLVRDMARYLGALYRASGVTSITYNGVTYSWSTEPDELKGSNWRDDDNHTLVSAIASQFSPSTLPESLTITTDKGDITVNINVTNEPAPAPASTGMYLDVNTYPQVITITAIEGGNYTGTLKLDFTILPEDMIDISKCMVVSDATYTSAPLPPTQNRISVIYKQTAVVADVPTEVEFVLPEEAYTIEVHGALDSYVDAKTYSNAITIVANPDYNVGTDDDPLRFYGTLDADYVIKQRDLADDSADPSENDNEGIVTLNAYAGADKPATTPKTIYLKWTGEALVPVINADDPEDAEDDEITNNINLILNAKKDLAEGQTEADDVEWKLIPADYSYTIEPSPMIDPGIYKVIFTGRGNFTGMREVNVMVLKDINELADNIKMPYQIIPDNLALTPSQMKGIEVKDGNKVLVENEEYTLVIKGGKPGEIFDEENPIYVKGKYYAYFYGKEPYYTGQYVDDFRAFFEYIGWDTNPVAGTGTNIYNNPTSIAKKPDTNGNIIASSGLEYDGTNTTPVSVRITDVSDSLNLKAEITYIDNINEGTVTACDPTKEIVKVKPTFQIVAGLDNGAARYFTFNIVGVQDNAFKDLPIIHCLDLTQIEGYTPDNLTRSEDGPFNYYPVQSLVYFDGTRGGKVAGTNYIYKKGENDFRCEELKIYDDIKGDQQGFETDADYIGGGHAWEFRNIYQFVADKVTNTRVFTAGQHYTTCLPYKLQMNSALKAYTLDAASDNIFGFKQYTAKELDQFTPYVLIPSKGGNLLNNDESTVCYVTPTSNRGFLPLDEGGNRRYDFATPTGHIMYGSNIYMGSSSTYPTVEGLYIMQSKNQWKRIPAGKTYNNACVLPMRGYIMLPNHPQISGANPSRESSDGPEYISAKYMDVDGVAEISIDANDDWTNAEVYDLQGRKVDTTARLPKGVYIVNGQKRIRK